MAGDTWLDTVTEPTEEAAPAPVPAPERLTVLPRVEHVQGVPQLVQDARKRFDVTERLGQGGLGEVLGALDNDIGRRVAIKRIRPDRASRGAFLRFVQEVRTVGRLDHPGIVPIHDVGRDDEGEYYFVMKYVRGQTLYEVIEALKAGDPTALAAWPFERRVAMLTSLLQAVAHAHEHGVVHRDIKPENVMIGAHGQVQLLDWGVAKLLDAPEVPGEEAHEDTASSGSVTHTRVGSLIGTPRYMSPEQAGGEPVDVRADTWALSMLFYELLTLSHPFDDVSGVDDLLQAIRTRDVPRPPHVPVHPVQGPAPAELQWFAVDGLHRDAARRYQTVGQMLERLQRRAEGDIPVQCPMTFQKVLLRKSEKRLDRYPVLFTSIVLGGVLFGAGTFGAVVLLAALVLWR